MHKRGQAEDLFNDLIPALVLIAITIIIIVINSGNEIKNSGEALASEMHSLRRLDLVTYLRMPATIYGSLSEYLFELGSGSQAAIKFTKGIDPYVCDAGLESELRNNLGQSYSQWSLRAFKSDSGAIFFSCHSDDDFFTDAYRLSHIDANEALLGTAVSRDWEMAYFLPLGMRYFDVAIPSSDPSNSIIVRLGMMLDE